MGLLRNTPIENMFDNELTEELAELSGEQILRHRLSLELGRPALPADEDKALRLAAGFKGGTKNRDALMNEFDDGLGKRFAKAVKQVDDGVTQTGYRAVPLRAILNTQVPPGFRIKVLNDLFKKWRLRRARIFLEHHTRPTNAAELAAWKHQLAQYVSVEAFVEHTPNGKARFLLDLILGPNSGTRIAVATDGINANLLSNHGRRLWPSKNPLWIPLPTSSSSRGNVIAEINGLNKADLKQMIRDQIVNNRMNKAELPVGATPEEEAAHAAQAMILNNRLPGGDAEIDDAAEFIIEYLEIAGGKPLSQFDNAALTKIIGKSRKIEYRDFIHSVLEARNAFRYDAHAFANASVDNHALKAVLADTGDPTRALLRYGFADKITLGVQRSGYEHGNTFEIDLGFFFREAVDAAGGRSHPVHDLIEGTIEGVVEQHEMGGKASCDWLLRILKDAARGISKVQPAEAKAVSDAALCCGFTGEYFKQWSSYYRRLFAAAKKTSVPDDTHWVRGQMPHMKYTFNGAEVVDEVEPHHLFFANEARLGRSAHNRVMQNGRRPMPSDVREFVDRLPAGEGRPMTYSWADETPPPAALQTAINSLNDRVPLDRKTRLNRLLDDGADPQAIYEMLKLATVVQDQDKMAKGWADDLTRRMGSAPYVGPDGNSVPDADAIEQILSGSMARAGLPSGTSGPVPTMRNRLEYYMNKAQNAAGIRKMLNLAEDAPLDDVELTPRDVFIMRFCIDPKSGVLDYEYAGFIRDMPTPPRISHNLHGGAVSVAG